MGHLARWRHPSSDTHLSEFLFPLLSSVHLVDALIEPVDLGPQLGLLSELLLAERLTSLQSGSNELIEDLLSRVAALQQFLQNSHINKPFKEMWVDTLNTSASSPDLTAVLGPKPVPGPASGTAALPLFSVATYEAVALAL